jgi:hypothetical protein
MIPLYNITFLIKRKQNSEYSTVYWSKFIKNTIDIPDNIYNESVKMSKQGTSFHTDIISAYLLGWFYRYNEDQLHLDDIEVVLVHDMHFQPCINS